VRIKLDENLPAGLGVQYWLARWLAEHTDQTFFTSGPIR
jgi:hypothetical protein